MNSNPVFHEKLKEFKCARCNECCRQSGFVYLSESEARAIAKFKGMDLRDFVNQYCDLIDRRRLVLKKFQDEACIFLSENGCSVYPARPKQCRDFPIFWRTERSFSYCEGLKNLFPENEGEGEK